MKGFFAGIIERFNSLFTWLSDSFDKVVDFFKDLPAWIFSKIADAIVGFFDAFPVPDFFTQAASAFGSVPPEVVYFAQTFHIGTGVTMVLGAYLLRFILRRIPLIG